MLRHQPKYAAQPSSSIIASSGEIDLVTDVHCNHSICAQQLLRGSVDSPLRRRVCVESKEGRKEDVTRFGQPTSLITYVRKT